MRSYNETECTSKYISLLFRLTHALSCVVLNARLALSGWFEMVPPDFAKGPFCKAVSELSSIMPRKFFTRTLIKGIRIVDDEDGKQTYKERIIKAGTVLRVSGNFSAKWRTCAETGVHKKKKEEWTTVEIKYLKCLDIDEQEVLLPCSARGKFNIIYEKGATDSRCIFRLKDIISDFDLPLKVRLIYGKAPVVPCIFTGMLALKDCALEDTIIGSTTMNKRNVLFEIPADSPCTVQTAENEDEYADLKTYIDAKHLCVKYALSYSTMIKLSPDLDTNQQLIQHIPTAKSKNRHSSLKTLDLITNISLTDDEPTDVFMESSDTDSIQSNEQASALPPGTMMELKEIKRQSTTNC